MSRGGTVEKRERTPFVFSALSSGNTITIPGIGEITVKSISGRKVDLEVALERLRVKVDRRRGVLGQFEIGEET